MKKLSDRRERSKVVSQSRNIASVTFRWALEVSFKIGKAGNAARCYYEAKGAVEGALTQGGCSLEDHLPVGIG